MYIYCQRYLIIVQQLEKYKFRNNSFIVAQFHYYFVHCAPLCIESLMCLKHFNHRKSQIMMNCLCFKKFKDNLVWQFESF